MTAKILIVHGGRFGQSEKIARFMRQVLNEAGVDSELAELNARTVISEREYTGLLLVTSVRYGFFTRQAYRLIAAHRPWLERRPALLVTVSLTARSPKKRDPQVHVYTKKMLAKSKWPGRVEVVAGALEYPRYRIWDRLAIQLIMRITNGPTDKTVSVEYTDWEQVHSAAASFAQLVNERRT